MQVKTCKTCKQTLSTNDFYLTGDGYYNSSCKECSKRLSIEYVRNRIANMTPEELKEWRFKQKLAQAKTKAKYKPKGKGVQLITKKIKIALKNISKDRSDEWCTNYLLKIINKHIKIKEGKV